MNALFAERVILPFVRAEMDFETLGVLIPNFISDLVT